jgi:hypothetical protein
MQARQSKQEGAKGSYHLDPAKYLQGRSHHQQGVSFLHAPVHEINFVRIHCVPEENDIWLQRASTSHTGWDLKALHLLV